MILQYVYEKGRILVPADLQSVNPAVETGVLLPKGLGGTSKCVKSPKKPSKAKKPQVVPEQVESVVTKLVREQVHEPKEPAKEVVPSKSGVLKRLKKIEHRRRHSPNRPIVEGALEKSITSPKGVSVSSHKRILKPQLIRKEVTISEITAHVSTASKKRRARDMVKNIKKKAKALEDLLDEVVVETDLEGNESPILQSEFGFDSPQRDSPVKSNF
ncbi:unnamed protein product [Lactuca virosa]|uniref:Uncharacterized protein n=1 Tax=Lactuca virosa TaxID=75947 RepID=A0AAU9MQK9_9ASTR|nr:unnamed protein product [Lactuca virosa]